MKIARVFFNVDMRCNFEGIRKFLESEDMKLESLSRDMVVILLNSKKTCFKLLVDNTYIIYYKNGDRRIPLEALQFLPQRFGGSEMEFNRAVEKSLREKLKLSIRVVKSTPPKEGEEKKVKIIRRPGRPKPVGETNAVRNAQE